MEDQQSLYFFCIYRQPKLPPDRFVVNYPLPVCDYRNISATAPATRAALTYFQDCHLETKFSFFLLLRAIFFSALRYVERYHEVFIQSFESVRTSTVPSRCHGTSFLNNFATTYRRTATLICLGYYCGSYFDHDYLRLLL